MRTAAEENSRVYVLLTQRLVLIIFCSNYISQETVPGNLTATIRSSHQRCSVRKVVLGNFTKFTGKHLFQSIFFNKVAGLRPATLLKKRLWHRCFPVNFVEFLRTPFLQNTPKRLFLNHVGSLTTISHCAPFFSNIPNRKTNTFEYDRLKFNHEEFMLDYFSVGLTLKIF